MSVSNVNDDTSFQHKILIDIGASNPKKTGEVGLVYL